MDELTIGDKIYISSKRAAKITGYAKDYVGQLCREGRVEARLVGRNWYVLESSIREHRFGESPLEQAPAGVEPVRSSALTSSATERVWNVPRYEVEVPETIPPLLPKIDPVTSRKVVSDMQSAWQEWFTAQKTPVESLPESSEEFNGLNVPAVITETVVSPDEVVHITRLEETTSAPYAQEETSFEVPLHRIEEVVPTTEKNIPRMVQKDTSATRPGKRERQHEASLVLKSVFLGIAMIAAVVALIGTGVLADLLKENGVTDSSNAVVQYLGGQSEFDNR